MPLTLDEIIFVFVDNSPEIDLGCCFYDVECLSGRLENLSCEDNSLHFIGSNELHVYGIALQVCYRNRDFEYVMC